MQDKEVELLIQKELLRERNYIDLIPSENYASEDVLEATGSIFTNKYAEGYPHNRYYPGTEVVDELELLTIERAKTLFKCNYANVQPLSGSTANLAIYNALLKPGDKILAMNLDHGGHLSHGFKLSITAKFYEFFHYNVNKESEELDYEEIRNLAVNVKPKLIIAGASNYSRFIDWSKFRKIADEVNAYLLADISHISALIASGLHPNPFPYAHVAMTTMQKQIRGPRGAIILSNDEEIAKKINIGIFPGLQGGPQENIIAAKAVALFEAMKPEFKVYCEKILANTKAMCEEFKKAGYHIVSNGTDNHLFCINVYEKINVTADIVEKWLKEARILANKNIVPFEKNSAKTPSGIRIGSPCMTTRGLDQEDFINIAQWMIRIIDSNGNKDIIAEVKDKVEKLLSKYPLYK